jgi:hypothetical protein
MPRGHKLRHRAVGVIDTPAVQFQGVAQAGRPECCPARCCHLAMVL